MRIRVLWFPFVYADIYEKWIGFQALCLHLIALVEYSICGFFWFTQIKLKYIFLIQVGINLGLTLIIFAIIRFLCVRRNFVFRILTILYFSSISIYQPIICAKNSSTERLNFSIVSIFLILHFIYHYIFYFEVWLILLVRFLRSACPFVRLLVGSPVRSYVRTFAHSSFVCSFVRLFSIRMFVRLLVRSFVRSFAFSFVCSHIRSFACSFVRFVHMFVRSPVGSLIRICCML